MKKILLLLPLIVIASGCNSYRRILGQEHEGDGSGNVNPGAVRTIAIVGVLPAGNVLTITPPLSSSEPLVSVKVRLNGVLADVSEFASSGQPSYTFDGTRLTISNYDGAANLGTFADNFQVLYQSTFPAGYHTAN